MKKVCFVIASLHNSAGMERMSTELANSLCKHDIQVDFILHTQDTRSFFKLDSSINVYSLKQNGEIYKNIFSVAILLRRIVIENKYDILINVGIRLAVLSFATYFSSRCKVISWEHFALNNAGFIRRLKHYLGVTFSNHTIVLTEADIKHYPKCLQKKMSVIQNFTTINTSNKKATLSNRIVLAAGRIDDKVKGFDYLIKAWKIVNKYQPKWKLRICGGGDSIFLKKQIETNNLSESVVLAGRIQNMDAEYSNASIFVCSSIYEPFGLVIIEAKSYGLPVVSFNCPFGPKEIIQDKKDGILVENKNIESLANSLLDLMNNQSTIIQMGKSAQQDYLEKWSLDAAIQKWLKLILN